MFVLITANTFMTPFFLVFFTTGNPKTVIWTPCYCEFSVYFSFTAVIGYRRQQLKLFFNDKLFCWQTFFISPQDIYFVLRSMDCMLSLHAKCYIKSDVVFVLFYMEK